MPVRILVTGGTFDKEYDEITGQLYFKDSHMREILELGRSKLEVKIRTLMLIDSLDMTDEDRATILDNCKRVDEDQIVITHGTDTMTRTAKVLAEAGLDKTIVLDFSEANFARTSDLSAVRVSGEVKMSLIKVEGGKELSSSQAIVLMLTEKEVQQKIRGSLVELNPFCFSTVITSRFRIN